jgi:hypothetical protein
VSFYVPEKNECTPCADNCGTGQYRFGCGHSAAGQCVACSTPKAHAHHAGSGSHGQAGSCREECDAGYHAHGGACIAVTPNPTPATTPAAFTMKGCYNGSHGPAGWTNNGGRRYSCTKGSAVWYANCRRFGGGYTSIVSQCRNTCKNAGYTSMAIHDNTACFCSNLPLGAPDKNGNCGQNRAFTGL